MAMIPSSNSERWTNILLNACVKILCGNSELHYDCRKEERTRSNCRATLGDGQPRKSIINTCLPVRQPSCNHLISSLLGVSPLQYMDLVTIENKNHNGKCPSLSLKINTAFPSTSHAAYLWFASCTRVLPENGVGGYSRHVGNGSHLPSVSI